MKKTLITLGIGAILAGGVTAVVNFDSIHPIGNNLIFDSSSMTLTIRGSSDITEIAFYVREVGKNKAIEGDEILEPKHFFVGSEEITIDILDLNTRDVANPKEGLHTLYVIEYSEQKVIAEHEFVFNLSDEKAMVINNKKQK